MSQPETERPDPAAERLNETIDRLLAERAPSSPATSPDEADLWQVAALLKQARPDLAAPRPAFMAALGARLRADAAPPTRLSRRQALAASAGALAAGAAGFAVGRLTDPAAATSTSAAANPPARPARELTLVKGEWTSVARCDEVPPGAVVPFTAGAIMGHLVNQEGNYVAMSAICTHMGCVLRWEDADNRFVCPCHNAWFGTDGVIIPTPDYPWTPPPLPRLQVKVEDDQVWVLGTAEAPPLLRGHHHEPA
jgi:cytochrome b6-f complex iron-sulfur subunit